MTWLSNGAQKQPSTTAGNAKHSFDIPVHLNLRRVKEPIAATLMHIAISGCRVRCWMYLEPGTALSFNLRLQDGHMLCLSGVIAARYAARAGQRGFEYAIALDSLPAAEADALSREAAALVRHTRNGNSYDTSLVDISRFTGFRAPADFTIVYRRDDPRYSSRTGEASDLTGNALRLRCEDALRIGDTLVLTFILPGSSHKASSQVTLRAKIAAQVKDSRRRAAYEIEFIEVNAAARNEIARYLHAAQTRTSA